MNSQPESPRIELERRYQLIVESIKDYAIYMLTKEGMVATWNPGAEHFKGYRAEEIIGQHFSCFYTEEDRIAGKPAVALQTAATQGKFEAEAWRVRKDGSCFWAHVVIDPVKDEAGNVIGFAKITRDVTEKHNAEELLQKTQAALAQSQKMEAIGKLTGGIAHDFSNLLQGIIGHLDMMRLRIALGRTSELGHHLDAAISATKRSATLTHRLLAFARRQTLLPKPVDATWLVHSLMDLFRRTVGPDITVEAEMPQSVWWALCDQNQLESALLNLVINARDAMPDGGKVTIRASNFLQHENGSKPDGSMPPGEYVRLSVCDSGVGMTAEVMAQAFEPFFTTKPLGEGTGLGLSMVHGFMNQSGGYITIESEVGEGTVVHLYFPKYISESAAPSADQVSKLSPIKAKKHSTVLVVDDERTVRSTLCEVLQHLGYDVLVASDAHEALRVFEGNSDIDLLVTDIALPAGINGRQLATRARQAYPELKVLFVTGYAEQSVIGQEALPPGMQLLIKPFSMDTFIATVVDMTEQV
ncbi:MAG: PAS domain S-box protein [Burkholderiales bacterium]|nr:PAS domain S-box protein [Burkholderiales bacterium]